MLSLMVSLVWQSYSSEIEPTSDTAIQLCEDLLSQVEQAGMLPPDPEVEFFEVFGDMETRVIAEWEPEDD